MGDYLPYTPLGSAVQMVDCYDFSPTSSPTQTLAPTIVPPVVCASALTSFDHVCVLTTSSNQIKCWGRNDFGRLVFIFINKLLSISNVLFLIWG